LQTLETQRSLIGTNTYLIGSHKPYILVDTAEGLESYIPILTSALQATSNASDPDVSDIIISHWHHDHVGGLPSVLTLLRNLWVGRNHSKEAEYQGPKLHKYPFDTTKAGEHHGPHNSLRDIEKVLDKELYTAAPDGSIFHNLYDGQTFVDQETTTLLEVLHTPGHTVDSICLYLPLDRALYTADTVLGHGTAVFEDLSAYMTSLSKMLRYKSSASALPSASSLSPPIENSEYDTLYPGHGAILTNGQETIATYIKHRLEREAQIVEVLRLPVPVELQSEAQSDGDGRHQWTIWNLVRNIYKSYPENLWLPATRSIYLHLKKLEGEGLVRCLGGEGKDAIWELVTFL